MFISKTNILKGASPSVTTGAGTDLPSNMTNADFSTSYTASGSRLVISFGSRSNLSYVAVCATNLANGKITVRNGDSTSTYDAVRGNYDVVRPHVCMFNFEQENFSNLKIVIDSENSAVLPTCQYIAAGQTIEVPNGGEQSGYARNWLGRGFKSRVVGSSQAAPTASLFKNESLSGNLMIPNALVDYSRNDWQEFYDFAALGNPFFINEDQTLPESSYVCFQPKLKAAKAHSSTRALNSLSLQFRCYNGL